MSKWLRTSCGSSSSAWAATSATRKSEKDAAKKKMARPRNTSFAGLRFAERMASGVASGQQTALFPEFVLLGDGAGVAAA